MKLLKIALYHLRTIIIKKNEELEYKKEQIKKIDEIIVLATFNKRTDLDEILKEIRSITTKYINNSYNEIEVLDDIISTIK